MSDCCALNVNNFEIDNIVSLISGPCQICSRIFDMAGICLRVKYSFCTLGILATLKIRVLVSSFQRSIKATL